MDVVGPICESSDVLGRDRMLPLLGGRRPGGDHRCRCLRRGDGVALQLAAERRRGAGGRRTACGDQAAAPTPGSSSPTSASRTGCTGEAGPTTGIGQAGEPMTSSDPRHTRSFRLRLLLARLVVSFERLWPALWPTLAVLGVFVALSLFGLWLNLPLALHVPLLAGLRWRCSASRSGAPAATLARRRRATPALLGSSRTAAPSTSRCGRSTTRCRATSPIPSTQRLWALHRQRLIASLERLRLNPPRSDLPRRDPWALAGGPAAGAGAGGGPWLRASSARGWPAASSSAAAPPWRACRRRSTFGSRRRPIPAARHW